MLSLLTPEDSAKRPITNRDPPILVHLAFNIEVWHVLVTVYHISVHLPSTFSPVFITICIIMSGFTF